MSVQLREQYDKVYRFCYYRLKNRELAEDITQETFLRYMQNGSYRDAGRPLAYLYTVAGNLCMDEFRRQKRERALVDYGLPPEDLPNCSEGDPEDAILDTLVLEQELQKLDGREQELLLLRYVNEVPVADMAEIYGISRFALYRELKRILKKLERRISNGTEAEIKK